MARLRSHSVSFEQQVAQEYFSGDTLHGLAERRNISRNLVWTCVRIRCERPCWTWVGVRSIRVCWIDLDCACVWT